MYYGELYWSPAYRDITSEKLDYNDWSKLRNCTINLASPCDNYNWDSGESDCSLETSLRVKVPSKWLAENMGLFWNGVEGEYIDSSGIITTFDPSIKYRGDSAFLVNCDKMDGFLKEKELVLVWLFVGEKRILDTSSIGKRTDSMKFTFIMSHDGNNLLQQHKQISVNLD